MIEIIPEEVVLDEAGIIMPDFRRRRHLVKRKTVVFKIRRRPKAKINTGSFDLKIIQSASCPHLYNSAYQRLL